MHTYTVSWTIARDSLFLYNADNNSCDCTAETTVTHMELQCTTNTELKLEIFSHHKMVLNKIINGNCGIGLTNCELLQVIYFHSPFSVRHLESHCDV